MIFQSETASPLSHFFAIRYVKWAGTRWKVDDVEVKRPRLKLTLGGVWNGDESTIAGDS